MDIDDEFFGSTPVQQQVPQQQNIQHQGQEQTDQFQFANEQPQYQIPQYDTSNQFQNFQEEDDTARRIREEQDRILEKLRQKANNEYEQKQKRKEKAAEELEQYLRQKEKQVSRRKIQNVEKEKQLKQEMQRQTQEAGWKKVAANIRIKQGQQSGKKDINRMRQAIIHKKDDPALE